MQLLKEYEEGFKSDLKNDLSPKIMNEIEEMKELGVNLKKSVEKKTNFDVLRDLCLKYDLKYIHLSHYAKIIPKENRDEIKAFIENEIEKMRENRKYTEKQLIRWAQSSLYILAPSEHFNTTKHIYTPKSDPIVFYEKDTDSLDIVTTWGNDFTFFRKIRGLILKSPLTRRIKWAIQYSIIGIPFLDFAFSGEPSAIKVFLAIASIGALVAAFWHLLASIVEYGFGLSVDEHFYTTERNWNTTTYSKYWWI